MEHFAVRPALLEETEAVKSLYDDVIEANTGTKYDVLWRRDLHPSDASIEQAIADGSMVCAYFEGTMCGAAVLNHDFANGYDQVPWKVDASLDKVLCLHLFCVHPGMQGKGLAGAYLAGLADWAGEQGMAAIRLDVFNYNDPAKHLYEKAGYELIKQVFLTYEDQEVSTIPFDMYELAL